MEKHLLTFQEFRQLARPTSKHLDEDDVLNAIGECEDVFIAPAVGLGVYNLLVTEYTDENPMPDNLQVLLGGGYWAYNDSGALVFDKTFDPTFATAYENVKICHGLKKTLAYYAWSTLMREDGAVVTRSGSLQHMDAYGNRLALTEKHARYNDNTNVAEQYLSSCLEYLKQITGDTSCCCQKPIIRGHRAQIHAIGN